MSKLNLQGIQRKITNISNRSSYTPDIIYELLDAYGRSSSSITQLRSGRLNKSTEPNTVLQKDIVYFKVVPKDAILEEEVEKLDQDSLSGRYNPRFLIATNLESFAAKDTKKRTTLTRKLADLDQDLDFFYAWTGNEVTDTKTEAVADRRAADKMKELYAEVEKENYKLLANSKTNAQFRHDLNVFFSRLLFCFFAEDTGLFAEKQFVNSIKQFSQTDGSDLAWFFKHLFEALDSKNKDGFKNPFASFPYVNGSLFDTSKHSIGIPKFNAQARHLIIECGRLDWSDINPDIFGTIFQGIVDPDSRDESGMDYTSVPNIMKVIEPLFLDKLRAEFDKWYDSENRLWRLINRIGQIKVFDPACGSGNFLIISYKQLRLLENDILSRIQELKSTDFIGKLNSLIKLENFYGIEINDFAAELAILSLYIAEHQMNLEFEKTFKKQLNSLPLIENKNIVRANAARIDWQDVCPNTGRLVNSQHSEQTTLIDNQGTQVELDLEEKLYDEIYLIGNPPYKGTRNQTIKQKEDKKNVLSHIKGQKVLDYIAIWFYKGAKYIAGTKAELAFVSTNSITQGDQVHTFWPHVFNIGLEIGFAYTSFKWSNSAKDQAGVTVVIISLRNVSRASKKIYSNGIENNTNIINAYLLPMNNVIVERQNEQIAGLPKMTYGNHTGGSKDLFLSPNERNNILAQNPEANKYIRRAVGSAEFIRGIERYCLWITNADYDDAMKIPLISERVEKIRQSRLGSKDAAGVKLAARAHQFRDTTTAKTNEIIVPIVFSENYPYLISGILNSDVIIPNSAQAIYDPPIYLFAILESKMHIVWIRTVCGKLKTDYRYSSTLGYNTFPVPPLTNEQKEALSKSARKIILARAAHPDKTLAQMYNPEKMPSNLREAHNDNDTLVDSLYRQKGFSNDEDRLSILFDLYEKMTKKS